MNEKSIWVTCLWAGTASEKYILSEPGSLNAIVYVPQWTLHEVAADRDEWKQVAMLHGSDLNLLLKEKEETERRLTTLLTGLEALAGEWEMRALEIDSYADSDSDRLTSALLDGAATRLRTLTNPANSENNEV